MDLEKHIDPDRIHLLWQSTQIHSARVYLLSYPRPGRRPNPGYVVTAYPDAAVPGSRRLAGVPFPVHIHARLNRSLQTRRTLAVLQYAERVDPVLPFNLSAHFWSLVELYTEQLRVHYPTLYRRIDHEARTYRKALSQ